MVRNRSRRGVCRRDACPHPPPAALTYRSYLVVLAAVVGVAQFSVAVQRSFAERSARFAALADTPTAGTHMQSAAPMAAAGGIASQAAGPVAPRPAGPPPAPVLPPVRHGVRCDTLWTTADTCVEPAEAMPEVVYGVSRMPGY